MVVSVVVCCCLHTPLIVERFTSYEQCLIQCLPLTIQSKMIARNILCHHPYLSWYIMILDGEHQEPDSVEQHKYHICCFNSTSVKHALNVETTSVRHDRERETPLHSTCPQDSRCGQDQRSDWHIVQHGDVFFIR